jgi:hypothetical protein
MLVLLKPWRSLLHDLKGDGQSWKDAYEDLLKVATKRQKDIIEGIQFFHSAHGAAQAAREAENVEVIREAEVQAQMEQDVNELEGLQHDSMDPGGLRMTEEGLVILKQHLRPVAEDNWGELAVYAARDSHILPHDTGRSWALSVSQHKVGIATGDDLRKLLRWRQQMDHDINVQGIEDLPGANLEVDAVAGHATGSIRGKGKGRVERLAPDEGSQCRKDDDPAIECALPWLNISELKKDQRRAYGIMTWHLEQTLGSFSCD